MLNKIKDLVAIDSFAFQEFVDEIPTIKRNFMHKLMENSRHIDVEIEEESHIW